MHIEELRIGNYVRAEGKIALVRSINSVNDEHVQVETVDGDLLDLELAKLEAIPLDNKLLANCCNFNKMGRHKAETGQQDYNFILQDGHIILKDEKQMPLIHFWNIRYLHQLQNLYYSLKKSEMAINMASDIS